MERRVHELLFLFLAAMLLLIVCVSSLEDDETKDRKRGESITFHYRSLVTNPVTTPSTYTPNVSPPSVVNIPSTNPIIVTPNPPAMPGTTPSATPVSEPNTNPVNPSPLPVTNPVTTPSTNTGTQPATNPVSSGGLPGSVPVAPPMTANAPAVQGQIWCVAKSGSLEIALQSALDYACGIGGVDCSAIQQGGSCFNPNSLEFHASYAFNSYYLKNPAQTSCDFGGTAMITNANPSSGSCIFPSASSPSPVTQSPTMASPTPINPTPTTSSSSGVTVPGAAGAPPFGLNPSNPASGIAGTPGVPVTNPTSGTSGSGGPMINPASGLPITDFPNSPPSDSTSISMPSSLQPFISGFLLVISILTW
ncbi:hypothetical protein Leryth_011903 [Lithospermum erythrorhizon]|nr:hypothetical protein Leryth_011903 [Lithospermum erythrorhizon]